MNTIKGIIVALCTLAIGCGDAGSDDVTVAKPLLLSDGNVIAQFQPGGNWVVGPITIPAFDGCGSVSFTGSLSITPPGIRNVGVNPETGITFDGWMQNHCDLNSYEIVTHAGKWYACGGATWNSPCDFIDATATDARGITYRFLGNPQTVSPQLQQWPNWQTSVIVSHPDGQWRRIFNVPVTK